MTDESQRAGIDALLQKSTLPANVKLRISGAYQSNEAAEHILRNVSFFLRVFGAYLNLGGVESVTVADDHKAALVTIDQGHGALALAPTDEEFGTGFAVTVPVIRDDAMKSNIILNSKLTWVLNDLTHDKRHHAIHVLAHESAHAHDLEIMRRTLPELGKPLNCNWKQEGLFYLANRCWSEYIASHLSSRWGADGYCSDFEHRLCKTLAVVIDKGPACIHDFRFHRDARRTEAEIRNIFGRLFIRSSYLVGHIHGLGKSVSQMAPTYYKLVQETPWLKPVFERYEANLKEMHSTYGNWTSMDVFNPLIETCEALMNAGGVYYNKQADENYTITLKYPVLI